MIVMSGLMLTYFLIHTGIDNNINNEYLLGRD